MDVSVGDWGLGPTALFPAHKREPSAATVTLETETSSSGMS